MTVDKQPEALWLADVLESFRSSSHRTSDGVPMHLAIAAELRRLHAENEAAHCVGIQQERDLMAVEAQRDALLTALKTIVRWDSHTQEFAVDYGSRGVRDFYRQIAQEAIAKAEGANND